VTQIERTDWFNRLTYEAKVDCVKIFTTLGGFENSGGHQKKAIEWFNTYAEKYGDRPMTDFFHHERFQHIPLGLKHIQGRKIESRIEDGFEIETTKTVSYHQQILNFFTKYHNDPDFLKAAGYILTEYPQIYKEYRKNLRELGEESEKYKDLKNNGIDVDFVLDYKANNKFSFRNTELKPVSHLFRDQGDLEKYEELMDEAKKRTAEVLLDKSRKQSYFASDVFDTQTTGIVFTMPPITDAVALTSGKAFGTCFSKNGANEAALRNIFADNLPQDKLMMLFNESRLPIAYCRINYDAKNQGINIDNIEFDKNNTELTTGRHEEIWAAIKRGLQAQMAANKTDAKKNPQKGHPVIRINCKHDPYNKLMRTICDECPTIDSVKAPELEERHYKSGDKSYYANPGYYPQRLVIGPELKKTKKKTLLKRTKENTLGG
jgi:hypothetical protein